MDILSCMKKLIIFLSAILIVIISIIGYRELNSTYVTAKFSDLRPFHGNIPVYYKGVKIGKARDIKTSDDYNYSLLKIQLFGKDHKLPTNTKVYLKKEIKGNHFDDYLELILPETANGEFIKNGSTLEGKCAVDIEHFLRNQEPEEVENLKNNLSQTIENANLSLQTLAELFGLAQDILAENRRNIKGSVANLERSSRYITDTTSKINNSVSEEQISDVFSNVQNLTKTTNSITENIRDTGVVGINEIIVKTNCILDDTNCLTKGVRKTMSKPFGGIRLMFGKVVD